MNIPQVFSYKTLSGKFEITVAKINVKNSAAYHYEVAQWDLESGNMIQDRPLWFKTLAEVEPKVMELIKL